MHDGVRQVISENVVTWFAAPWIIRFNAAEPGRGLELLFKTRDPLVDERTDVADSQVVAQLFAFGASAISRRLQLPLVDVDGKDGGIRCHYGSTESFPAELTLSIEVATVAASRGEIDGEPMEGVRIPFLVCQTDFAIQTEREIAPQLSLTHNISRVVQRESCEVAITSEDLMQKSVLSGIAFRAAQERRTEESTALSFLRYSLAGSGWCLIPYYHPAGVRRISPTLFQAPNSESCQELWTVFTFPERLEKGVTAAVRAGFLLLDSSVSKVEISYIVRELLVGCSPLREG